MSIFCHWPFSKWGINFIGLFPMAPERFKFAVTAVDYFAKCAKALPLTSITEKNLPKFIRDNLLFNYGISHSIISNNSL